MLFMDAVIIISVVISLVVLTVSLIIVQNIIATGGFTGILGTVTSYIPVLLGIGGLVLAVGWAMFR